MPITASNLSGVVINEVLNAPVAGQDYNGSGAADSDDEFIELYNTSAAPVDISGWEIWESTALKHTFAGGTTIGAHSHYTAISNGPGATVPTGVAGDAVIMDGNTSYGSGDVHMLYDPGSNTFVVVGAFAASPNVLGAVAALVSAHPGATQVRSNEYFPNIASGNTGSRQSDGDVTFVEESATPGAVNLCFAEGTLIATPGGETAVEALCVGDQVRTAEGRAVPVRWIGRQTIVKRFFGEKASLVRIKAGTLGNHSDLCVTGDHGMVLDGMIVNASALVNGASIDWVPLSETAERFTVYHVETEAHDVILANGAPAETFVDYATRRTFDIYAEYLDLYGAERSIPEQALPRVSSARQVPERIRIRLGGGGGRRSA